MQELLRNCFKEMSPFIFFYFRIGQFVVCPRTNLFPSLAATCRCPAPMPPEVIVVTRYDQTLTIVFLLFLIIVVLFVTIVSSAFPGSELPFSAWSHQSPLP